MHAPASLPLHGRVILVTGACGGLGQAVTWACARAGARVVLLGRRLPKLTRLYDALQAENLPEPALYPLDLSGATPDDYQDMAAAIERELGRLDGIVHCAVEFKGLASMENAPLEHWFTGLHVNLTAPWLLTRACLPALQRREDAAVLFMLDDPAHCQQAYWGSYGVAKAGLQGLIKILHAELENTPVRVHGLEPGPMRTALRARAWFAQNPASAPMPEAYAPGIVTLLAGPGEHAAIVPLAACPERAARLDAQHLQNPPNRRHTLPSGLRLHPRQADPPASSTAD